MGREVCFGKLAMSCRRDVSAVKERMWSPLHHRGRKVVQRRPPEAHGAQQRKRGRKERDGERQEAGNRQSAGVVRTAPRRNAGRTTITIAREESGWKAKRRGGKKALLGEANSHGNLVEMET